ncbi:hypothetical protein ACFL4G_12305, partial [Thermodesulfobacteriota bacterium]
DYHWALKIIEEHDLTGRAAVLLSPVHGFLDPAVLAEWMIRDGLVARLQIQLHKAIWGDGPEGIKGGKHA